MKLNHVNFNEYDIHFFGHAISSTPHRIIRLDNNGEILLACKTGKTIEQLKVNGIKPTQSQIRLLQDWRLLRKIDDVFITNFIILDSSRTEWLRRVAKEASKIISPEIQKEVCALKEILKSKNYEKNIYSILFSYVLDNLVWDHLEEVRNIKEREITNQEPLWSGFLWANYPQRKFYCGTNSSVDKGIGLYLCWSKTGSDLIFSLYSEPEVFGILFKDLINNGRVTSEKVKQTLESYNIFDSHGNFIVPVIIEKASDSLYQHCKGLSEMTARKVKHSIDIENLKYKLDIKDSGEAIIIAYHEIIWEILNYFENQSIIKKPFIFSSPQKARLKDVGDLIFIVKQNEN